MINQFIDSLASLLGIQHKDVVALLVPISIFVAGLLTNSFIKAISNHNQRVLNRELFKINLRKLIIGVNRQGLNYQKLYPQLDITHSGSYTFNPVSIAAVRIFDGIKYEDLYKAFFKGFANHFAFNKKRRLTAFSDFYSVLEYLSQYHKASFKEINDFEARGIELQNLLNVALGQVSKLVETFQFEMHATNKGDKELTEYFNSIQTILGDYQSHEDHTHPINTEENLIQKLLELNRKNIDALKRYKDEFYCVNLTAALLDASNRFENLKNFKNAYSQRYLNYSEGFLKNKATLAKVYFVLLSPRFRKLKSRKGVLEISINSTAHRIKSIIGGSLGNLVEWYDWYAYTAFSLYFSAAFFPSGNQVTQLLNTSGIFAIGFLMRPIGGWVMGTYADKKGRKPALTLSVLLMSVGSLMIAVVPGYQQIGIAAPVILLLARMVQGLSVGGEYGTSATYLSEMATKKHRGFYSSFQYVTLIMGQLIALGVLILLQRVFLSEPQLHAWGWRIPFAIGAVLAITVMYLRRSLHESSSFKDETKPVDKRGTLKALAEHPKAVFTVIGLTVGGTVAFYTFTTYMQKFLVITSGFSKSSATLISSLTLIVFMLLQPAFGLLSDKIGRKPLLIGFGVLGSITTIPILTALGHTKDVWIAFVLIMVALIINSGYTSINAVVKAELFPANIRALGVGLPYGIAVSLFGGTAEPLALAFKGSGHQEYFYWYVTGCILLSLVLYITMSDTKKYSKID